MQHLRPFDDSLFERLGVPDILEEYVNKFSEELTIDIWRLAREHQSQIDRREVSRETANKSTTGVINFKQDYKHPFHSINYTLNMQIIPGRVWGKDKKPFSVEGGYSSEFNDGNNENNITAEININFNEEVVKKGLKSYISLWMKDLGESLYHELTHAYEDLKRKENGDTGIRTNSLINGQVTPDMAREINNNTLRYFLHTLYTSVDYEIIARVTQVYPLIKYEEDRNKRVQIIKNSESWYDAEKMANFSAQNLINDLYKELIEEGVPHYELDHIVSNLINGMMDTLKEYSKHLPDGFDIPEDLPETEIAKIRKQLEYDSQKNIRLLSKDPLNYFRHWEKEFHKKGNDLKRRLLKLAVY